MLFHNKLTLISMLLIFGFFSCNEESSTSSKHLFVKFMEEEFEYNFTSESENFLLITDQGCGSCKEYALQKWLGKYHPDFKLVISFNTLENMYEKELSEVNQEVYVDPKGKLNRLNFRKRSFSFITVKSGEVLKKEVFDKPDDYDEIFISYLAEVKQFRTAK